ncbi:DUF2249 domain-containing protein [Kribbella sp. NPDC023972]|uniref:DUF2249 domain-containing protein n=1 Tax=Kribbella sp. NPDC023972 TaxID=3154795 RepID=UPI003403BA6D
MSASEIFVQKTETDPDVIAWGAVREAHERLRSSLAELTAVQSGAGGAQPRSTALTDFCLRDVRRYLVTADRDLYAPAAGDNETRILIEALRVGAAALDAQIDELAVANPVDGARLGVMIAAALDLHLRIEESVLLPALAGRPGVDPVRLAAEVQAYLAGKEVEQPVIDVRNIARGGRHPRVFARYARLAPGEAFILVHNHDPKPLRQEFEAIHRGAVSWDYLQTGPDEWRVRIGRVAADA